MARATIPIQVIGAEGVQKIDDISFTLVVAADDAQFLNDGQTVLIVQNGGVGVETITAISVADQFGRSLDLDVTPTNAKESIAGPFRKSIYNQSDGYVHLDTADATLSVAAVKFNLY